ncbi:hypothetical protein FD24_GL000493 [Lactiplantibacillus pentosus DSM 20314]|uniref:Uncharacterized protein n=1 Tax=Lactiplantibacillus pentosus DSM 20314 TaxID=1423791 RepID=A0A837R8Y3_LACPE|nr:hypothetical protein FD24_GL000493 [Lactiplantibacillus pentosus DSM 20314]
MKNPLWKRYGPFVKWRFTSSSRAVTVHINLNVINRQARPYQDAKKLSLSFDG